MTEAKEFARELGMKIRHFRNDKTMSQEQVALSSGLNTNSVGMIERGLKSPTIYTLHRICSSLDITLAELFLYEAVEIVPSVDRSVRKVAAVMRQLPGEDAARIAEIVVKASEIGKK